MNLYSVTRRIWLRATWQLRGQLGFLAYFGTKKAALHIPNAV